jgi:hypothetical protein
VSKKSKKELRKGWSTLEKIKFVELLEESGGTGFINSVAPSFPEPARDGEENFANTSRHISFIQTKRRLSKYSL